MERAADRAAEEELRLIAEEAKFAEAERLRRVDELRRANDARKLREAKVRKERHLSGCEEEQEGWHAKLRPHFVKTQWASGATSDFLDAQYLINASTAYLILGLQAGLEPEAAAEEEGLDR